MPDLILAQHCKLPLSIDPISGDSTRIYSEKQANACKEEKE